MRRDLQEQEESDRPREDPQRRQAVQVYVLRVRVHAEGQSDPPRARRARRSGLPL